MGKVFVTESYLDDIADAIRGKNGTENTYKPSQMAAAITSLPDPAVLDDKTITANGTYDPSDDDLDGYSTVTVSVSGGGGSTNILSGTDAPTSSLGDNGDIYLQYTDIIQVPIGYTGLDYVQLANSAYIDLGIAPSNHYLYLDATDVSYTNDKHWFGTSNGPNFYSFTTYSNKYYWGRNGSEANSGSWFAGRHILKYNEGSNYNVILDGSTLGSGSQISASNNLLLGNRGGTANANNFRIHYLKLIDKSTGNAVREMIPVKRSSDDALGLYDVVNDVFYTKSGSGSLTAGDETSIVCGDIIATYLKKNGSWGDLLYSKIGDVNTGSES